MGGMAYNSTHSLLGWLVPRLDGPGQIEEVVFKLVGRHRAIWVLAQNVFLWRAL